MEAKSVVTVAWLLILLLSWHEAAAQTHLYFSLIISFGRYGFNSSGTVPAMKIALDRVHEMQILPGYVLENSPVRDSECERGSSLDAFFNDVQSLPVKLAVIGCGCSVATEPVAEISHRWNISQISPASAASTLSDRSRFRRYFRTDPTFEIFAPAVLSLLEHYGWSRIVFLTQNENLFNNLFTDVRNLVESLGSNSTRVPCCFQARNITVVNRPFETDMNPLPAIEDIFDDDYRIFFINSYSAIARKVICEAALRNLTSPRFVWISHGWYPSQWWTQAVASETIACSDATLEEFLERSRTLTVNHLPAPQDPDVETAAGITPNQFLSMYEQRATNEGYLQTVKSTLGFDAVWALAIALNKTTSMVQSGDISETGCEGRVKGELVPLELFNYTNGLMGCVIQWNLQNTDFQGTSGRVQFDRNGSRVQNRIRLHQYRKQTDNGGSILEAVQFGYTEEATSFDLVYQQGEDDYSVFPDGTPPDGSPEMIIHTFNVGLVALYYTIATLGIALAISCLVFNFTFRKKKVIKLTSPNLNYLVIAGVMVMYMSVYVGVLFTTDETGAHIQCILHPWLYVLGYLLAFGTVLAKMWRVYHIFHNPMPKMKMKDWHLVLMALGVTAIGIVLLVIRSGLQVSPPQLVRDNENREGRTELGIREEYFVWTCYEPPYSAFYCDLLIFAYLALLQIVGLVLAFQTRKVKITALNDSTFVAAIVYISSIVLVALVLVAFALRGYINIQAAIFSGGVLLLAFVFLILMFSPKIVNLYRDPNGEKIFDKNNSDDTFETGNISTISSGNMNAGTDLAKLQNKIREHEESIRVKDRKILELEKLMSGKRPTMFAN